MLFDFTGTIEEIRYNSLREYWFVVRVNTGLCLYCRLSYRLLEHKSQLNIGDKFDFRGRLYLEDRIKNGKRYTSNMITVIGIQ